MNTTKMAIASTLGAFAVVALLFAYSAMAASGGAPNASNFQQMLQHPH